MKYLPLIVMAMLSVSTLRGLRLGLGFMPLGRKKLGPSRPTSYTWSVDAGGNWSGATNWSSTFYPMLPSETATMGNAITAPSTVTMDVAFGIKTLTIASAFSYILSGAGAWTAPTGASIVESGGAINTLAFPISIPSGLTINNADSMSISGAMSGAGSLTKQGAGNVNLSGANTFTGPITISAGGVICGAANTLPTTAAITLANVAGVALTLNGFNQSIGSFAGGGPLGGNIALGANTLTIAPASPVSYDGIISGTGGVTKSGAGNLTLTRANTFSGALTINAATVVLGTGLAVQNANIVTANTAGAGFDFTAGASTVGSLAGGGATGGNGTGGTSALTVGNATSTSYDGVVTTSGGLTKQGTGNQTFTRAQSITGGIAINAGKIIFGISNALPAQDYTLANVSGAILDIGTFACTINTLSGGGASGGNINGGAGATLTVGSATPSTYAGAITGSTAVTKVGAGTLTLSGSNTFTGTLTMTVGAINCGATNTLPSTAAITTANTAGVSLNLNGFDQSIASIAGGGATGGGINLGANTLTLTGSSPTSFSAVISGTGGNLTLSGTGILTIGATNTFTGTCTINNGANLKATTANVAGTGPLVINSGGTLSKDTTGRNLANSSYTATGTVTLDGNTSGALSLNTGNFIQNGNVTVNVPNTGGSVALSTLLAETGGSGFTFTKTGPGTLTISGTATRTGDFYVLAGTVTATTTGAWSTAGTIYLGDTSGSASAQANFATTTTGRAVTVQAGSSGQKIISRNSANPTISGTLTLNDDLYVQTGGGTWNLSGTVTGAGSLHINLGGGSVGISGGTKSGWTGSLICDGGSSTVTLSSGATGTSSTAAITMTTGYTGTLLINSTWTGTGACSINGGTNSTLEGTGTINGAVTVTQTKIVGGTGNGNAGTLTCAAGLTLASTGTLGVSVGSTTTVSKIAITGNLTLNNNAVFFQAASLNAGTYTLFTYTGTCTGTLANPSSVPTGRTFSGYSYTGGSVTVTFT